ncbi:DinB family protein [Pseudonocardia sp. DLS-67]
MTSPTQQEAPDMTTPTGERADILETLAAHRQFLRHTVQGLTDDEARQRTTVSELTLGGLIKHVAETESGWVDFILDGPVAMGGGVDWSEPTPELIEKFTAGFRLLPDETLEGVLARYDEVARRTDDLVATVDLDLSHPLPEAPWFPKDARRSARRVFLHIVGETAQHAGHADIIRESLDGQKTMG